ncbi:hypothetical protein RvY_01092 [Ramazzottius varieornatus]|uniref:MARVEL domain-containing protein n=1 Tax=Ramazzottius varieornatus TaxID=947166 RepID=A0A1D1UPU6_RAMVA|nr:hypothetical protein RvY_01092 [Ramazzottius varieornatus]
MADIKGPDLVETKLLAGPTVQESSTNPRHMIRFKFALGVFGALEIFFGIISAIIGSIEAILLGGSNSFFAGPVLGIVAVASGVAVFVITRQSTSPRRLKFLLAATAILGLLIAVACTVVCAFSCISASQVGSEHNLQVSTTTTRATTSRATTGRYQNLDEVPTNQKKIVDIANDPSDVTNPSTVKSILIASAVFYILLAISALMTSLIAARNVCFVSKDSAF